MAKFTKTRTIKGNYKGVVITDGQFVDAESGEQINLAEELQSVYGENAFDITTSLKTDEDIDIQNY